MTHTTWRAEPELLSDGKYHAAGRCPKVFAGHALVADVARSTWKGRDTAAEANARLIAAAPDLLRACELALAHVPRSDDAPDSGIHGLMERAIAKAKGE